MAETGQFPEKNLTGDPAGPRRTWAFGAFRLDEGDRTLWRDGAAVRLTPKAFDLLVSFLAEPGRLLHKDELLARLWPNTYVEEGTLARHVSSLRTALGDRSSKEPLIQTVHKSGYRFLAEVRQVASAPSPGRRPLGAPRSLAVLPFKPVGDAARDEALELGLADSLIARFSALPDLCVRSIAAVSRYVGSGLDAVERGRQLGVDVVLEGTMQRDGDRLRLSVRLLDVGSGQALWSQTLEPPIQGLFALEDAVASRVEAALAPALSTPPNVRPANVRPAPAGSRNAAAYEAYLRGRYFWARRSEDALKRALAFFDEALAGDPSLAAAHAARADALALLAGYGVPTGAFAEARASAERALELDPGSADAHAVLGLLAQKSERRWEQAQREYGAALELRPNHGIALHRYGELLALLGRVDEGFALLERARQQDPTSLILGSDLAKARFFARDYAGAVREGRRTLDLDPTFPRARLYVGLALLTAGEHGEGLAELAGFLERDSSAFARGIWSYANGTAGNAEAARAQLDALVALEGSHYVTPYAFALAHLGLGQHAAALDWLERLVDGGHNVLGLSVSPLMDPIRSEPRFRELLRRAGL